MRSGPIVASAGISVPNWVDLLEHSYSLDGNDLAWMSGILANIPGQGGSEGNAAFTFRLSPSQVVVDDVAVHGGAPMDEEIQRLVRNSSAESMNLVFRSGKVVATLSEYIWSKDTGHADMFQRVTRGPPDVLGVVAHSGDGRGVVINMPLAAPRRSTVAERRRWMQCAAHLGAAMRLRSLGPRLEGLDGEAVEAVLDGAGKVREARGAAAGAGARQALRDAVYHIDKARSRLRRHDPDCTLERWEALVHGRWSLIDRFDTDQRRFMIAVKNDPDFPDPRGLSLQERQIAEYVGLGRSLKEISYILGVPSASAENCCRRAQAKLGLNSRVELASFFSPQGVRARLAEFVLDGDEFLIGASPTLNTIEATTLTTAEHSVLALIIAGSSNSDIALRRATSVRTVANQIQAIFRKLGARSRCELIALIARKQSDGVGF